MYFKQNFFKISRFQRKIPSRRKHLYNWLSYFNFLYSWFTEYKFFKNNYKSLLNQNLFKFNFLVSNYSSFIKSASFPFSLVSTIKGSKLLKQQKTLSIINTPMFQLTSSISKMWNNSLPATSLQFLFFTSQKTNFLSFSKKTIFYFDQVFKLMTIIQLLIFKEIYRIFTLTLLLK
jgi:hypothetical protein